MGGGVDSQASPLMTVGRRGRPGPWRRLLLFGMPPAVAPGCRRWLYQAPSAGGDRPADKVPAGRGPRGGPGIVGVGEGEDGGARAFAPGQSGVNRWRRLRKSKRNGVRRPRRGRQGGRRQDLLGETEGGEKLALTRRRCLGIRVSRNQAASPEAGGHGLRIASPTMTGLPLSITRARRDALEGAEDEGESIALVRDGVLMAIVAVVAWETRFCGRGRSRGPPPSLPGSRLIAITDRGSGLADRA